MYEDLKKYISERVSGLRKQVGVTSRQMSLMIGFKESYVNRLENETCMPSLYGLYRICDFFNISLADFFDREMKNPVLLKALLYEINKLDYKSLETLLEFIRSINK